MPLTTGQVLQNRYRIVSLLGQGGMGAVYRAWDTRLQVPVALKEMIPQPGLDSQTLAQLRQQFQQEATVLARLDHPHLVRVSDFFEAQGNGYLVMNFVEGESLADRIEREGALDESQVLAWADQLLDALAYCHAQGVLHRDVKPQNVVITPEGVPPDAGGTPSSGGNAVLVDFGLVKLWDPSDPRTRTAIRSMGTPEYAPPEQYDATGHTDPRSDIYGLGATLYHALTNQSPPTATQRIVNPATLSPVRRMNPLVSPHVEAALVRALELQPEARFQNSAEMRAALRNIRTFTTPIQSDTDTRVVTRRAPRPSTGTQVVTPAPAPGRGDIPWKWIIAGGAAIAAALLVGGAILGTTWFFGRRPPTASVADLASATPTGEPRPPAATVQADRVLDATFVTDVTASEGQEFPPGTAFTKVWRMQNTGNCAWEAGTRLAFISGDITGEPVPLPTVVAGSVTDVSVNLVAPTQPGTYRSDWQLEAPDGARFGDTVSVQIVVPPLSGPTATPAPPTATPPPTSTPIPTAPPTPACPAVTGPFATLWQAEQERLGCATNAAHTSWMAQQHFEWGQMFWRKDSDGILAVHDSGIWGAYRNIWYEGDPDYSCPDSAPQESPPTPKRGFGKIWCTYAEVRNGLGWATDGERGFDGTVQDFEQGAIIRTDTGKTYVLFDDGTWSE